AQMRTLERKGDAFGRVVKIGQRRVEAGDAMQVGILLPSIVAQQEELRGAVVVVRAQIGVPCCDWAAGRLGGLRESFDTFRRGAPFAIPTLAIADLDAFGDSMRLVKIGAAELRHVHYPGREMIRPAGVV